MHWLKAWRLGYPRPDGRRGMRRKELARKVRNRDTGCSEVLIEIIEGGGITHPGIADRIASVVGATAAQRDTMVHKKHRGTWRPDEGRKAKKVKAPGGEKRASAKAKKVVCLDRDGREIARYDSMLDAAQGIGCSCTTIMNHCKRNARDKTDEFCCFGCTFRYAAEWDAMSEKERLTDLRTGGKMRAEGENTQKG